MPPKKKKKKKTQKFNVENILKGMELDLMRAGKIPGLEGTSLVSQSQMRSRANLVSRNISPETGRYRPQGGGITPLMPISPLDLAFETLATGLAHAEGVDPRLAIAGSVVAARYGTKAAKAVNIEGGGYLSRRAYKKGMESASKDPMFSDIDYSKEVRFIRPDDPLAKQFAGRYLPKAGRTRRHYELYPNQEPLWDEQSIELAERTLFSLLSPNIGKRIRKPDILRSKEWAESTVRHESRHYMQNVEGMARAEVDAGMRSRLHSPSEYGYSADWYNPYRTLIKIPKPKNPYPAVPLEYINKQGLPEHPYKVFKKVEKKHGEKYANKYIKWYKGYTEWDVPTHGSVSNKEYFQRPIEVEARIEEISSLGDKNILSTRNIRAFKDLKDRAGYSTEQILDMVTEYRVAKKKYDPAKYRAQAQEFKKPSKDFLGEKIKAKHW